VSQRLMRSLVHQALDRCQESIAEHLPASILAERSLVPLSEALQEIHFPASWSGKDRARRRIVYDEFFLYQLLVARRRTVSEGLPGIAFAARGELSRRVARALPFDLTAAQKRALVQIRDDMRKPRPMNRLLMGEVGSGKTLVAALACCLAIEDGYQAAFLAPTEILAEQHFASLRRFLPEELVNVHLLTGRMTPRARRPVLAAAAAGDPAIVVGTHALFQEGVEFGKLGFVVVDEQHRFGVQERAELLAKGPHPDVLVMSATPIPRTLAMMFHGDLDISTLDELPKGRGKVTTRVTDESARESVYRFIRDEIDKGHRAYVVYPIITESEKVDLRAATEMADQLRVHPAFRGRTVGLLHGKMKGEDKSAVMLDFRAGRCHLLVTTTVVEVGVDVPEATVMVVEHPERYGLSQLHQLRGRIGRGAARSVFVLMAGPDIGSETLRRLRILESTTSGFRVAEEDLKIRGPGEVFGTRQHGMPELRLASLREDRELLEAAHRDALALVESDPELAGPDTAGLRRRLISEFGDRMGFYHVA
jgi:ATP-dependent DNA helicase RecG